MNDPLQPESGKGVMKLRITPFSWDDWNALWQLRNCQLAELGIISGSIPSHPDLNSPFEGDFHRIEDVYLGCKGNFWIAWYSDQPVGHIGAQDMGDWIELRRMYVREEYRRCGIGAQLVNTLLEHSRQQGVRRIKLWTDPAGPGRLLYRNFGFQEVQVSNNSEAFVRDARGEIRMTLFLLV